MITLSSLTSHLSLLLAELLLQECELRLYRLFLELAVGLGPKPLVLH